MLSEEEKKAIKILGTFEFRQKTKNYNKIDLEDVGATNIVLNLITKLQKENEILKRAFDKQTADMSNNLLELQQKDKQIDLMSEFIDTELSSQRLGIVLNQKVEPLQSYKKEIKQYFEKQVKEKGK